MATAKKKSEGFKLAPDLRPWDQQPWERIESYERFSQWLKADIRPNYTNLAKTYGVTPAAMSQMVSKNLWLERAKAYDDHEEAQWQKEKTRARRKAAEANAKLANKFRDKISTGIDNLDTATATAADLARLTDSAVKLLREAFGEPTSHTVISGPENGPVQVEALSDSERIALMQAAIEELQRRKDGQ